MRQKTYRLNIVVEIKAMKTWASTDVRTTDNRMAYLTVLDNQAADFEQISPPAMWLSELKVTFIDIILTKSNIFSFFSFSFSVPVIVPATISSLIIRLFLLWSVKESWYRNVILQMIWKRVELVIQTHIYVYMHTNLESYAKGSGKQIENRR